MKASDQILCRPDVVTPSREALENVHEVHWLRERMVGVTPRPALRRARGDFYVMDCFMYGRGDPETRLDGRGERI